MKKVIITVISAVIALFVSKADALAETNVSEPNGIEAEGVNAYSISHSMKKGHEVKTYFNVNFNELWTGIYECTVLLNQEENSDYAIENVSVNFMNMPDAEILSCIYSLGEDCFYPGKAIEGMSVFECHADGNSIRGLPRHLTVANFSKAEMAATLP